MAKATAGDDTASLILTYFNNPYALQKLEVGREYLFFGKVGGTFTAREMVNPVMLTVESAAASPLVPVYPQTEGVSSAYLAKCVRAAFAAAPDIEEPLPGRADRKIPPVRARPRPCRRFTSPRAGRTCRLRGGG